MRDTVVEISLKSGVWKFVSFFIFAIILAVFLNRIICEVNKFIIDLFKIKLFRRCPNVPCFVPVSFDETVNRCDKQVMPDVEFSVIVKERLQVLLNDKCLRLSIFVKLLVPHQSFDFNGGCDWNSVSSIRVLSWFYDPNSLFFFKLLLFKFLDSYVILIPRNDMIRVWQVRKRIYVLHFRIVPVHQFKKNFLWSNDRVIWNVVGDNFQHNFWVGRLQSHITSGKSCIWLLNFLFV